MTAKRLWTVKFREAMNWAYISHLHTMLPHGHTAPRTVVQDVGKMTDCEAAVGSLLEGIGLGRPV